MKVKLVISLLALLVLTAGASAQQDPNDPGAPDSIIVAFTHYPDAASGDSLVSFSVTFAIDEQVMSASSGYGWDFEGLILDSATFSNEAVAAFSMFRFNWANNNRDSTNAKNEFQVTVFGILGTNTRMKIVDFYGHVTSWVRNDTIRITQDGFVQTAFVKDDNEELVPIWAGDAIIADVTSVGGGDLPVSYDLAQNYPNPFNPATMIIFDLPERAKTTLEVFNVLGQKVATLVDAELGADRYEVEWDASLAASGIYFYRLTTDDFVMTKKMMLLK